MSGITPTAPPSTNGHSSANGRKPQDERSDSWGSSPHHPSTNGSAHATDAHDAGRVARGPDSPGNPFARLVAELRWAAVTAVPKDKVRAIFVKMSDLALEGKVSAAKFVAAYLIGKPQPARDPDRSDVEEWRQFKEEAPMMRELMQHGKTPDPILPLTCARGLRFATTRDQCGMLEAALFMPTKEADRLFELGATSPHTVCNLLRDKARNPDQRPSTNGKRKKHRR
jgi:hypothetical protein